ARDEFRLRPRRTVVMREVERFRFAVDPRHIESALAVAGDIRSDGRMAERKRYRPDGRRQRRRRDSGDKNYGENHQSLHSPSPGFVGSIRNASFTRLK